MFRKLLNTIIRWAKEIWSLFEIIEEVVPAGATFSPSPQPTTYRKPSLSKPNRYTAWREEPKPKVSRHRYIEVEGYAENLRIDQHGRYDILQLAKFAESFVWISQDSVEEFIDETMDFDKDFIDGSHVLWLNKADCIEWAYHQYSALADLL